MKHNTIINPDGFECYVRAPQPLSESAVERRVAYDSLDPKLVTEVEKVMASLGYTEERFAGLGNFRPTTRDLLPTGLAYPMADLIGDTLVPTFVGGRNEEASYPTQGKERFFVEDTTIAVGANVKRYDIGLTWTKVSLLVHGLEAATETREQSAGQAVDFNVTLYKGDVVRDKLNLEKEKERADFLTTSGNYAAGHFSTLSGTTQWSDYVNSDPVTEIFAQKYLVWSKTRKRPDKFWCGAATWVKLASHPKVTAIAATALTGGGRPNNPVEPAFLAAILRMDVVVGEAGYSATPGAAAFTEMYGKFAGLTCTGGNEPLYPRFALNVGSESYPATQEYRDERVGPKGADVVKVSDAWKTVSILNTGGYLWTAAVA